MKPEIKEQWIRALRSGEYSQWTGMLRSTMGYCCLGVLCDLHKRATSEIWDYNELRDDYLYLGHKFTLPEEVMKWAGLDAEDPIVFDSDKETNQTLSDYNDDLKYTFNQIADLIGANL